MGSGGPCAPIVHAYLLRNGASQKKHALFAAQHACDFIFERVEQQRIAAVHVKLTGTTLLLGVDGEARKHFGRRQRLKLLAKVGLWRRR